ncbi:hypothetical protein JOF29_003146 [Kribbella aluminosa]|uniref:Uncharacterized protein n=1 Tax=Kribbella aluminosa TaxID=416017 RepID=A0ABS4UKA4_9ACTN|nr:DUF6098 family protein [Kribbella aluminosa]MBP2352063.1 hypothetical protein [Kribbella aluminosa]
MQGLFAPGATLSQPPDIDDLAALVDLVATRSEVFLRYSEGPNADARAGPSRDYEADVDLSGLSVTTVEPEPWWPRATIQWTARRLFKYAELGDAEGRYPWLLTGDIAGYGPDHEPLLVNVRPLARITPPLLDQARTVYEQHFHVGKNST